MQRSRVAGYLILAAFAKHALMRDGSLLAGIKVDQVLVCGMFQKLRFENPKYAS